MSFEYLSDKRANFIFAGLAPDVSGIDIGRVRYLPSSCKIVVLGLLRREFRRRSGVPTVGSPGMSREFRRLALQHTLRFHCPGHTGRVRYSYRTCPVWTTRGQRLVFQSLEGRDFRRESGVPTVGSPGMCREFRHLIFFNSVTWFSNLLRIGSSDVSREFRRSGVPTFIGSSDASQLHCNGYAYRTCPVLQRL